MLPKYRGTKVSYTKLEFLNDIRPYEIAVVDARFLRREKCKKLINAYTNLFNFVLYRFTNIARTTVLIHPKNGHKYKVANGRPTNGVPLNSLQRNVV